jgi:hypothetical protein
MADIVVISFKYRPAGSRTPWEHSMESTSGSKSVHTERPISTWNGFVVMAIGLALIAVAIWQLVQAQPVINTGTLYS